MPNENEQPYPRGPTSQPYRGPVRVRRSDGRREVWSESYGYLPAGDPRLLPSRDQEYLRSLEGLVSRGTQNAQLAQQFNRANAAPRPRGWGGIFHAGGETGGTAGLPVPEFLKNPVRQRMEGLTSQMVRGNIREGQAGTMNSIFEQLLARQQYPTVDTWGETNAERVFQMLVDEQELIAASEAAQRWADARQTIEGFETDWARNHSRRVRAEATRQLREQYRRNAERRNGTVASQAARSTQGVDAPPRGIPASEWSRMNEDERARVRELMR